MVTTLNDCYLDLKARLKRHGVAGAQMEAKELICAALELSKQDLMLKKGQFLFDKELEKVESLVGQRLSGVPLQHLIGEWEFYGLTLKVSRDTLIPRPDTETLAECGINYLKNRGGKCRMLDLCCGTGCVGIAVMKHTDCDLHGVFGDLSREALAVCRENIVEHGLSGRAMTVVLDATKSWTPTLGKFNLILSNPPYIPTGDIPNLDIEVRHEPVMALDGGTDGLDFYRAIVTGYREALQPGGLLAFEVGFDQADAVMALAREAGYSEVTAARDLTGVRRVVLCKR